MCPLRYIVFAISAIVALIVLFWGRSADTDEDALTRKLNAGAIDGESAAPEEEQLVSSEKTSIVDFFTGKYLMRQWRKYRQLSATA